MRFNLKKRVQWIGRRGNGAAWRKEYGIGVLALLAVAGIFVWRGGADGLKNIFVRSKPAPEGYLEIYGRIQSWQAFERSVFAVIETPAAGPTSHIFGIDGQTRFLRKDVRDGTTIYTRGDRADITLGMQLEVYLRQHLYEDPEHWAHAVVYSL